jgi:hypothetical protein
MVNLSTAGAGSSATVVTAAAVTVAGDVDTVKWSGFLLSLSQWSKALLVTGTYTGTATFSVLAF